MDLFILIIMSILLPEVKKGSQQSGIPDKPGIVMGFFFCHGNPAKHGIVYPDDCFSFCVSAFE